MTDADAPLPATTAVDDSEEQRAETGPARPTAVLPPMTGILTGGLQLAAAASADVRTASLYFGLLLAGCVGPFVALVVDAVAKRGPEALDSGRPSDLEGGLLLLLSIAFVAIFALAIEASAVAVAILGGRAAGRAIGLRDAIARSRQVFWRMAVATVLVGIASFLVRSLVARVGPRIVVSDQLLGTLIATILTSPLAYASSGIVLGDVGAIESLRRSLILTRARLSYAAAIAVFALVVDVIELFALSAGIEVVARIDEIVRVDLGTSGGIVVTILAALVGTVAVGSLVFTIVAIQAAPQVVAFLALTRYSGGLERAGDEAGGTRFRWVTRPMLAGIGVGVLVIALSAPHLV